MHILLVNISNNSEVRMPQGLLYLGSAIHNSGHQVEICDEALFASHDEFVNHIINCKASIIGFSVYSVPSQLKKIQNLCHLIKQNDSTKLIIWGGWHATLYPRYSILNENVDIVVKGPAEAVICELLNCLEEKKPINKIESLLFIENGKIIETKNQTLTDDNLFPKLNFDLIEIEKYLNKHDINRGILQYITSRGCHGGCKFCVMSKIFKRSFFKKPREAVISELKTLYKNYHIKAIHFSDDNAFRNNQEAKELCEIIESVTNGHNIPWRCATRVDTLSRTSDEVFTRLKESKCKGFSIGIESGNNRVLQLMHKQTTVTQINKAITSLSKFGFDNNLFFFLFNYEGETNQESMDTIKLACKVRLLFKNSDIALYNYYPIMSNNSWIVKDGFNEEDDLLETFEQKNLELKNKKAAGVDFETLRFYFAKYQYNSKHKKRLSLFVSKLLRLLAYIRIEMNFFTFPFEYRLIKITKKLIK